MKEKIIKVDEETHKIFKVIASQKGKTLKDFLRDLALEQEKKEK